MTALLLANNNAPTPAISEHFKGEVDKGAGSGWGREGKYRPPPTHLLPLPSRPRCSVQPLSAALRSVLPRPAPVLCFLFLSPPFPLPLSLSPPPPGYCAGLRAQGGEPGRYPAVPERPAAPRQPPRRGSASGGWRRGSGGCPRLPIAARLRRRPEPRRCGRGGKEGGREGGKEAGKDGRREAGQEPG